MVFYQSSIKYHGGEIRRDFVDHVTFTKSQRYLMAYQYAAVEQQDTDNLENKEIMSGK